MDKEFTPLQMVETRSRIYVLALIMPSTESRARIFVVFPPFGQTNKFLMQVHEVGLIAHSAQHPFQIQRTDLILFQPLPLMKKTKFAAQRSGFMKTENDETQKNTADFNISSLI
jgi:hypothetical protein